MNAHCPQEITRHLNYFQDHANGPMSHCIAAAAPVPGPHVVVVGGTHGNEPGGVAAAVAFHRLLHSGQVVLARGRVSFMLGNPQAYARRLRFVERNLNRAFSEPDPHSLEGRRAGEIQHFFRLQSSVAAVLDLHSVSVGDCKLVVYSATDDRSAALAAAVSPIDLHLAYFDEHMPGTLIRGGAPHGIPGLMVECGNHADARGSEVAGRHIRRLLAYFGLIEAADLAPLKQPDVVVRYDTIQPIVPRRGFSFRVKALRTGTRLAKGEVFAGDRTGDHVAPEDCYIAVPARFPDPDDTDAGFLCRRTLLPPQDAVTANGATR